MTRLRPFESASDGLEESQGSMASGTGSCMSIADPETSEGDSGEVTAAFEQGRYRMGREIGAGGMGRVSLVHDLRLLRDVAWKRGDGRLLREARILAQLEHPGIVPIHDMGFDRKGAPYFAMRVVTGRSLAQVLKDTPSDQRASLLRPLLQAAEAVAFAHHRGIVHRDLKPANIMIGSFGESHVVDWGLARVLDEAEDPIPVEVRNAVAGFDGGRIGTPSYMSPEQEAGRCADRRSDVYGLGRMLADIIGGRRDDAPPELRAIVTRSVATDPDARYPHAAAFASDLARYLDGARVQAHTYRPHELLRRFVGAYRVPLLIAAAGGVLLSVLLAMYIADIGEQRERAESAETSTRTALARSDQHLSRALIGEARRLAEGGARAEAELLAAHALASGEDPDARGILSSFAGAPELTVVAHEPLPCLDAQVDPTRELVLCVRGDGVSLWRAGPLRQLWSMTYALHVARLVAGGVVLGAPHETLLLDLEGRVILRERSASNPSRRTAQIGGRVVIESNGLSILADVPRGRITPITPCDGALHSSLVASGEASPAPGSELVAALCKDGSLRRAGLSVMTPLVAPEREGVRMERAGPDQFVVGTNKGEVLLLDVEGRVVRSDVVVSGLVRLLAPSPDGRMLLVAGEGDPIKIVTLPGLANLASLPRRAKTATWDLAKAGELVTTGALLERWRLTPAAPERPLLGAYRVPLKDGVVSLDIEPADPERLMLAFGPHVGMLSPTHALWASAGFVTVKGATRIGRHIIAAGARGIMRLDADTLALLEPLEPFAVRRLAALADGTSLIATYSNLKRLIGSELETIDEGAPIDLSSSPNREFALLLRERDHALLRLRAGVAGVELIGYDALAEAVAIGNDGEHAYTARLGEVVAWDGAGHIERVHRAGDARLVDVEGSADGRWVAAGARDGTVYLWRSGESEARARFTDHDERVPALTFTNDPDGPRWLVTGSWDRSLRVRDLAVVEAPADVLRAAIAARYSLDLGQALGGAL